MPERAPPADFDKVSLAEIARLADARRLPPVASWNPERCGESEMRIARDGTWYHQGRLITRPEMVRLFSSILRREPNGGFVLVTPSEKLDILVEDAPFVAIGMRSEGNGHDRKLAFQLNTRDSIIADSEHRLFFAERNGQVQPYLQVRAGLDALISRPVYYELAEIAVEENASPIGLWSADTFFAFEQS